MKNISYSLRVNKKYSQVNYAKCFNSVRLDDSHEIYIHWFQLCPLPRKVSFAWLETGQMSSNTRRLMLSMIPTFVKICSERQRERERKKETTCTRLYLLDRQITSRKFASFYLLYKKRQKRKKKRRALEYQS